MPNVEAPQYTVDFFLPCVLWLVYCGTLLSMCRSGIRAAMAAVNERLLSPLSTAVPQLAMAGKIQLAEALQFESFYTVPIFYFFYVEFVVVVQIKINPVVVAEWSKMWGYNKPCVYIQPKDIERLFLGFLKEDLFNFSGF